ncbi:VOC family protein [Actinoplanes sp. NBC_00393]|uniref:VOC family protein n=1 Tax=Actinoplanes sp. NBC_00393 TaxID=2975953 RepID=UPI002E1CC5E2
MKPATVVVSLPITDLDRSLRFYRDGLGLETADVDEGIIAFELPNLSLFLIEQSEYAKYASRAGVPSGSPAAGAIIISCAIGSKQEVDDTVARAASAGGTVAAPPAEADGSYSGYFSDPDGHVWELVHNERTEAAAAQ